MSEPRKNLSLFFQQIKFIVFKQLWLKKVYQAIVPHLFYHRCIPHSKFWFSYSLIPVGFRAILMSFLSFLSQKKIPRRIFKTRGYFKEKLSKKLLHLAAPSPIIINLLLFKNAINSKCLQLEANIFRIFISLWYLPLVKISKKSMR